MIAPEIECPDCDGNGWVLMRLPRVGGGLHEVNCPACYGRGWRDRTPDEEADAAEAQCDARNNGEPPITMDEQHAAAWAQKQELRR